MHPISVDESLLHSDRVAACTIASCGMPNIRMKSFRLCATANDTPPDRSASTPNHLGNAVSPYLVPQSLWYRQQDTFQYVTNAHYFPAFALATFVRVDDVPALGCEERILRLKSRADQAMMPIGAPLELADEGEYMECDPRRASTGVRPK
jgi:hypothetical protein